MTDQFTVDEREYRRRKKRRTYEKYKRAIHTLRTGPWTPEEDAIVVRGDLFIVEKVAMLQRSPAMIEGRQTKLARPRRPCVVCDTEFIPGRDSQRYCGLACYGLSQRVVRPERDCQHCGITFRPKEDDQKYCSRLCVNLSRPAQKARTPFRPCESCGTKFRSATRTHCRTCTCQNYRCQGCGSQFDSGSRRKYCSLECITQARQSRIVVLPRPCLLCGTVFKPKDRRGRYCSRKCGHAPKIKIRECAYCGVKFRPKVSGGKYCSQRCGWDAKINAKRHELRTCGWCGTGYTSTHVGSKYCRFECSVEAVRLPVRLCEWCGTEFAPRNRRQRFCSRSCGAPSRRKPTLNGAPNS